MRTARAALFTLAALALNASSVLAHDPSHSSEVDDDAGSNSRALRAEAAKRVTWRNERSRDPVVNLKLLGINDFHGQLSPKTVAGRPTGGAAVLAAYLQAAAGSAEDGSLIIHAGDHIGASPPNSALLQDEPSISFLNLLANRNCFYFTAPQPISNWVRAHLMPRCNVVGTLGNHEFDEGLTELQRVIYGGNSSKGPFLENPWRGARFPYVSANVVDANTGKPVFAPYTIKIVNGVRIGIIGAVLTETPTIVTPSGVAGVRFLDEATAINQYVKELRGKGVHAIVVTIHKGTFQTSFTGQTSPDVQDLSGPIIDVVKKLDDDVDVVISGHTHAFTNALVANGNGKPILLTQAFSASTAYDDIDIAISRKTGDVVEKSAAIVTTWADAGPGLNPDVATTRLVASADNVVAPLVNQLIGVASSDITAVENSAGESAIGNLIADAQRVITGVQFSFMNPGGIRASIAAGEVTWGELFTVQPFGNDLVSMDLSGAQIKTLLEQQWQGQTSPRILKISGFSYTWDAARAVGDRVVQIRDAQGTPLNPDASYRATVNSFLAGGGDNFVVLVNGTHRVVGPTDLDALIRYVQSLPQPFTATIDGRIERIH